MVWEDLKPSAHPDAGRVLKMPSSPTWRCGGSTNAIVHILAMARRAGIDTDARRLRPALPHARRSSPICGRPGSSSWRTSMMPAACGAAGTHPRPAAHRMPDRHRKDARRQHRRRRSLQRAGHPAARPAARTGRRHASSCAAIFALTARSSNPPPPIPGCSPTAARRSSFQTTPN